MARVGGLDTLLLNPNGGATKFFFFFLSASPGLAIKDYWKPDGRTAGKLKASEGHVKKASTLKQLLYMMLHDINKNDVEMRQCEIWSHFFTNEFYLLGPDMLAKGKIHILPPRAGNSSPISVPEILSA